MKIMEATRNIEEGLSVNIKRTDGRIHSALISGINWDTSSVTVEWFERGETKGKEVEIAAVLALNPDLSTFIQPDPSQIHNLALQESRIVSCADSSEESEDVSTTDQFHCSKEDVNSNSNSNIPATATLSVRQQTNNRPSTSRPQIPTAGKGSKSRASGIPIVNHVENVSQQVTSTPVSSRYNVQTSNATSTPAGGGGGRTGAPRRSNVVKEVERLKKNREERRLRQAEEKAEKEALMNQDPGNPNWEFLSMIRDYQAGIEYKPLKGNEPQDEYQITVCVRKRPLNKKELSKKEVDVISVPGKDSIIVHEPKNKVDLTKYLENQHFRFDYVFNEQCSNDLVYKYTAKPLVKTIFEGGMATCFAYGQTGSGKTHTMGGANSGRGQDCKDGIYAMVAKDVFHYLSLPKYKAINLIVSASFFEIYSGKVFDLLADKQKLRVLEDGKGQTQIVGLTEKVVDTVEEVLRLIQHGNSARTSGQTSANANSSRSHAIFQVLLRQYGQQKVHGKFSLIDLAGNERGADTSSANRQTRMEGAEINKSLLALKECIRALGKKGTHLPFRVSKLTQVLRDSFIGDKSRTCMIAMVSPGMSSCENTLNTLRYADRVKELAVTDPEIKTENKSHEEKANIHSTIETEQVTENSDLERLRSLNEGDMSADMYIFHEAISQLQMAEDEVLDNHKAMIEYLEETQVQAAEIYELTKDVDYDQDAYSQQWESLLTQQISVLSHARNLVTEFRSKLVNEEQMSQNMKRNHFH
ncbi:kinesin-like protein Klp10A [Chrysoperla carnea]|uniref:kinesin-like protein Klp10A n=1 Tax=Chrysoperla carnea TaxID=189513 RepID=UPI001D07532D|nr:kinesin-like protein Klp10A [Chrysoperla carnea]